MRLRHKKLGFALAVLVIALVGAALYLLRPPGGELSASGHDEPAHGVVARLALAAARVNFRVTAPADHVRLVGLVPVCRPLSDPGSRASVFAAATDTGASYMAAFYRGDDLAGAVDWQRGAGNWPSPWFSFYGDFSLDLPRAERALARNLEGTPDSVRYVGVSEGVWVVARLGEREQGTFFANQGARGRCWPATGRVYDGAAILRYLQHVEDFHGADGCARPGQGWE